MHSTYVNQPAVLNVGKAMASKSPDTGAIILIERLRRIIQPSTSVMNRRNLSITPLVQTIPGTNPNGAIPRS